MVGLDLDAEIDPAKFLPGDILDCAVPYEGFDTPEINWHYVIFYKYLKLKVGDVDQGVDLAMVIGGTSAHDSDGTPRPVTASQVLVDPEIITTTGLKHETKFDFDSDSVFILPMTPRFFPILPRKGFISLVSGPFWTQVQAQGLDKLIQPSGSSWKAAVQRLSISRKR